MGLFIHSQNFNGAATEILEWIRNFIPHCILDLSKYVLVKSLQMAFEFWSKFPWIPRGLIDIKLWLFQVMIADRQTGRCSDVIMSAMASQIAGASTVDLIVCSGASQRKYQSSASLAFVRGIHWGSVNSPHKGPVTRKMLPFDDVIMRHIHMVYRCLTVQRNLHKTHYRSKVTEHFINEWYESISAQQKPCIEPSFETNHLKQMTQLKVFHP